MKHLICVLLLAGPLGAQDILSSPEKRAVLYLNLTSDADRWARVLGRIETTGLGLDHDTGKVIDSGLKNAMTALAHLRKMADACRNRTSLPLEHGLLVAILRLESSLHSLASHLSLLRWANNRRARNQESDWHRDVMQIWVELVTETLDFDAYVSVSVRATDQLLSQCLAAEQKRKADK